MKYAPAAGTALALLLVSTDATAELYQWIDPATRTRQLSGTPPAWYRGTAPGPRVKVFAHGQLIDDTAIPVGDEDAAQLRNRAFGAPATGTPAPAAASKDPAAERAPSVVLPPPPPAAGATPPAANAADLKALIEAWDKNREAAARAVLHDKLPPAPPAADTARP